MEVFRRIFLAALLAGSISGVVTTFAHHYSTVPLIEKLTDAEPSPAGWRPAEGFERTASTAVADIVTGLATALLMLAAYALFGREMNWLKGLHWGLGAFAALTLWPNIGLPAYLTGQAMAPHLDRQIWWAVTAVMAVGRIAVAVVCSESVAGNCRVLAARIAATFWCARAEVIQQRNTGVAGASVLRGIRADESVVLRCRSER
jgi:predicted cobalt transporter CbtA